MIQVGLWPTGLKISKNIVTESCSGEETTRNFKKIEIVSRALLVSKGSLVKDNVFAVLIFFMSVI